MASLRTLRLMEWWQWIAAIVGTLAMAFLFTAYVVVPWIELIRDARRIDEWQKAHGYREN